MKIWLSPYALDFNYFFNSESKKKQRFGALIKIEFEENGWGYSDFHTGEFLNESIEEDLKNIFSNFKKLIFKKCKKENLNSVEVCDLHVSELLNVLESCKDQKLKNSLNNAAKDYLCRKENKNLLSDMTQIKNHYLITDITSFKDLRRVEELGFDAFKIKLGRSLGKETIFLKELILSSLERSKFRLDFNGSQTFNSFKAWLDENRGFLGSKIDFIEDPFYYSQDHWESIQNEYSIDLALDMINNPLDCIKSCKGFSVLILKPALQDLELIINEYSSRKEIKFVFTHFMDHSLGQMSALCSATQYKKQLKDQVLTCGLCPGDYCTDYELFKNEFNGPYFKRRDIQNSSFFGKEFEKRKWTQVL